MDTAGIEDISTHDTISGDAQALGKDQHRQADLQLLCIDASQPLSDWSRSQLASAVATPRTIVWTKGDRTTAFESGPLPCPALFTSAITGIGLDELRAAIATAVQQAQSETRVVASTAIRCRTSLQAAAAALAAAAELAINGGGEEWIAAELRLALTELGEVIGAVYTDDILDRVFSRFCIGK